MRSSLRLQSHEQGHVLEFPAIGVCSGQVLCDPSGTILVDEGLPIHLSGLLSADGRADSEVSRRIGAAGGDFEKLQKMWWHSGISKKRKLQLSHTLVIIQSDTRINHIVVSHCEEMACAWLSCDRFVSLISSGTVWHSAGVQRRCCISSVCFWVGLHKLRRKTGGE